MRKSLIILLFTVLFFGCKSEVEKNQELEKMAFDLGRIAAESKQVNNKLPLGFEFNMSEQDSEALLASLVEKGVVKEQEYYGDAYEYVFNYPKGSGGLDATLSLKYHQNLLYELVFCFDGDHNKNERRLSKYLKSTIDTSYIYVRYLTGDLDAPDVAFSFAHWIKSNKVIKLIKGANTCLIYTNAPVDSKITSASSKEYADKAMDKAMKKRGKPKVENNSLDASVSQVKAYLKENLKDSDSYEGIEWSKVQEKDNGYIVRHKYKAKNSLGGYVVENKVYSINFDGEIVSVTDYK